MEIAACKKIISRFKRTDLESLIKNWKPLSKIKLNENPAKLPKKVFASAATQCLAGKKLKLQDVGYLDLLFIQKYWQSRMWHALDLNYSSDERPDLEAETLQQQLSDELNLYLNAAVHVTLHKASHWIHISVLQKSPSGARSISAFYIIHPPNTDALLMSGARTVGIQKYIHQALMSVLGCHSLHDRSLSGRHLPSLIQLILNKHAQRLLQGDLGQLHSSRQTTSCFPRLQAEEEDLDVQVVNEFSAQKIHRKEVLTRTFGHFQQPQLEKLEYKMETRFHGLTYAPDMAEHEGPFNCKVTFEGSNVLEGLRQLGEKGLARVPLKPHLTKLPSLAKNKIVLKEKN